MNNLFIGQDGTTEGIILNNLLVVGRPGSGRFNFINRYINDLTHSYTFEQLRLTFVDPKAVLLDEYKWLPHTLFGVVSKEEDLRKVLNWTSHEIDQRLEKDLKRTPVVIIIDEIADFIVSDPDYFESAIIKIAQNSDQTNIYLVLSTSRIDKVILTDNLRQFFQWRVAFGLNNSQESYLVLDESGAENLTEPGKCIVKNLKNGLSEEFKVPYFKKS